LKGGEIVYMPLVTLTRKTWEINHRDLTNRVGRDALCIFRRLLLEPQAGRGGKALLPGDLHAPGRLKAAQRGLDLGPFISGES